MRNSETRFKCVGAKPDVRHHKHSRVNLFIPRIYKQVNNPEAVKTYSFLTSSQTIIILPAMKPQRVFIAFEFPLEIVQALDGVSQSFQHMQLHAVRWVNAKNMHLTLRFLGDTYPDRLEAVKMMLTEVCARYDPFEISIEGSGVFPNFRSPRVVWVGIHAPEELRHLQSAIEKGCREAGFIGEERLFKPHLTLGRVSEYASAEDIAKISSVIQKTQVGMLGKCVLKSLSLIKSDLNPGGPVYSPLDTYYLLKSN